MSRRKLRAAVVAALVLVGTLAAAPRAEAAEVAFRPTNDGFTKEAQPSTNLSDRSWLTANGEAGRRKRIYLKYRVRGIPAGASGVTARLRLHARTTADRPVQVHASRSVDWTEGTLASRRGTGRCPGLKPFYDWLGAHGHGDKPFMLGEYGTVDDPAQPGRKATWFNREVSQVGNFPNLRALVYFDRNQDCDWRVGSAPGSLAAYRFLSAAVG